MDIIDCQTFKAVDGIGKKNKPQMHLVYRIGQHSRKRLPLFIFKRGHITQAKPVDTIYTIKNSYVVAKYAARINIHSHAETDCRTVQAADIKTGRIDI